jgi:hypothetical protein
MRDEMGGGFDCAMPGLQPQLLQKVTLRSGSEAVTVEDCSEQRGVLM